MQGTYEWFLLIDNHVSLSSKLGTLTLILYTLQFLPSVKKTSKWETKLEACFPHIYFSRSHHQKCGTLCVSVCLCMMGIKLSVLPMLSKHSCTELYPKARNVEILWYLLIMGSLFREGSCWLPTLVLSQAISLHIFNYWGPEVYIALLQTSGIQKCCLVQWLVRSLQLLGERCSNTNKLHESHVLPKCSGYCYGLGRLIHLDVNFCSANICQRKGTQWLWP